MEIRKFWLRVYLLLTVFAATSLQGQDKNPKRKPVMLHILSDCSGRIFLPRDMVIPPRDLKIIEKIVKTSVSSKKGYGIKLESFEFKLGKRLNLSLADTVEFYAAGSRYFPVIKFSTLRTGGISARLMPPVKNYLRLSYRANYKRDNNSTIGEDLIELENAIKGAYENEIDYYGLNVLAELEFYISHSLKDTNFQHVFVVFTDGFVNSSNQLIWSPKKVSRVLEEKSRLTDLFTEPSRLNGFGSKLILLETGGYDYNPKIGRTGERTQNDILKELWSHWAGLGNLELVWATKWDEEFSNQELEELIFSF